MRSNFKPSISSRASVRSLVIACIPATTVALAANSPALGFTLGQAANQNLNVDDNSGANTNAAGTNRMGNTTNSNGQVPIVIVQGVRG